MKNKRRNNKLSKKKRLIILITIGLVITGVTGLISSKFIKNNQQVIEPEVTSNYQPKEAENPVEIQPIPEEKPAQTKPVPAPEPASQWPIIYTNAESSSLTVVVNKKHKLPSEYEPSLKSASGAQLRPEAADALGTLLQDASTAGVPVSVLSSYRSYSTQVSTYNKWVSQSGQAAADTFSARPGHSEHQLGLAVDLGNGICNLETCFGNTAAGQWLAANAHRYGFIIRYPEGKQTETGYQYEPWHLRYVGLDVASSISNGGQTLDQYYSVEAGGY